MQRAAEEPAEAGLAHGLYQKHREPRTNAAAHCGLGLTGKDRSAETEKDPGYCSSRLQTLMHACWPPLLCRLKVAPSPRFHASCISAWVHSIRPWAIRSSCNGAAKTRPTGTQEVDQQPSVIVTCVLLQTSVSIILQVLLIVTFAEMQEENEGEIRARQGHDLSVMEA